MNYEQVVNEVMLNHQSVVAAVGYSKPKVSAICKSRGPFRTERLNMELRQPRRIGPLQPTLGTVRGTFQVIFRQMWFDRKVDG